MSVTKTAVAFVAIAVALAALALIGVLSVKVGRLNREIQSFEVKSARVKAGDRLAGLEARIEKIDRQTQENAAVANRNYKRHNKFVSQLGSVVGDIKGMEKSKLLSAVAKIKQSELDVSELKQAMARVKRGG